MNIINFFLICIVGGVEFKLGPLGTSAIYWPVVPAPGDCEDGEFGGMNDRGNRSIRRKPAPTPLFPPQIPLDQTRDWTWAAAVGSQRLTASAMARPSNEHKYIFYIGIWILSIANTETILRYLKTVHLICYSKIYYLIFFLHIPCLHISHLKSRLPSLFLYKRIFHIRSNCPLHYRLLELTSLTEYAKCINYEVRNSLLI
jgi:hypothetical protein